MVNEDEIKQNTHYGTVGFIGQHKEFSWSILEFKKGCIITIYIHKKGIKEKIAENEKLENSYKIIADWINGIIDSGQMKLCKRACDRIAKEIK